jgi:CheY-like chemotaxis protein
VSSEPDKGSTFAIYLPSLPEEQPRDSGDGSHSIPRGHERILVVDDEEDLAAMGREMLTGLGYLVTAKTCAKEALALFRLDPSRFDLIISDQTMPEMTGADLAKEVLALRPDMPIIMCTGFSHLVDSDSAKVAGIGAFVLKPLTKKEMARTIRRVLDE